MKLFRYLVFITVLALIPVAVQNAELVTLDILLWQITRPLSLLLVAAFFIGVLTGIFIIIPAWWQKRKDARYGLLGRLFGRR